MEDYESKYLTFVVDDGTVNFSRENNGSYEYKYSSNDGSTWDTIGNTPFSVTAGNKIILKGNGGDCMVNNIKSNNIKSSGNGHWHIEGNAMSLLCGDAFTSVTSMEGKQFSATFRNCTNLTSAENMVLPATTLSNSCYASMFYGCTNLTKAPKLSASTLVTNCYRNMFKGCRSLNSITCLAEDITANLCTGNWVKGVSSNGTLIVEEGKEEMWKEHRGANGAPNNWRVTYNEAPAPPGPTPTVEYRWFNLDPTVRYDCDTTTHTKYYLQIYRQSTDGGQTWTDVVPEQTQRGEVYEYNSTDCGYTPGPTPTVEYRWFNLNIAVAYDCDWDTHTKYYVQIYQQSTDGGQTWTNVVPERTQRGDVYQENSTDCGYVPPQPLKPHLIIKATDSCTIKFSNSNLSVSTDGGRNWSQFTNPINLSYGEIAQFKGTAQPSNKGIGSFSASTGSFVLSGNVMSLLYGDDFEGKTSLASKDYAFWALFFRCTGLTSIDDLVMPATTLSDHCYEYMFKSCKNLKRVKRDLLPAMTMKPYCYNGMFDGCQLQYHLSPPDLLATTLAEHCYDSMFKNTDIRTIGSLPATTLAEYCYKDMFAGVKNLYSLSNTLMAKTLVEGCYEGMFSGCTNLQGMYCLAVNGINENNSTTDWLSGVASSGTFTKTTNVTWPSGGSGIPEGWTVNESPYYQV